MFSVKLDGGGICTCFRSPPPSLPVGMEGGEGPLKSHSRGLGERCVCVCVRSIASGSTDFTPTTEQRGVDLKEAKKAIPKIEVRWRLGIVV